jgi:hypothetical protein
MTEADGSINVNQSYPDILARFAEYQYYNVYGEFRIIKEIDQDGFAVFNVHHAKDNKVIGKVIAKTGSGDKCSLEFNLCALSNEDIKERMAASDVQALLCGSDVNGAIGKSDIEFQDELYEKARYMLYLEKSLVFTRFTRELIKFLATKLPPDVITEPEIIDFQKQPEPLPDNGDKIEEPKISKAVDIEKRRSEVKRLRLLGNTIDQIVLAETVHGCRSTVIRDLDVLGLTKKRKKKDG